MTGLRQEDFAALVDPFRTELVAHCSRMLGSAQDAEDQVQETYLRAWRSYDGFEGRSSLRTWLYTIATNVCLTELETRGRRPLPSGHPSLADTDDASSAWQDQHQEQGSGADPAAVVASRQHRRDALSVAWRLLSVRQRAVLILHDVLTLQAAEIGSLLAMSSSAVYSMLRRARREVGEVSADDLGEVSGSTTAILDEYAAAFESGDLSVLVSLLADDVVSVPATGEAVAGRAQFLRGLARCPGLGASRLVPLTVRGRPAFGVYRSDGEGRFRAVGIDVLDVSSAGIDRIEVFEDRALFSAFGLPLVLGANVRN